MTDPGNYVRILRSDSLDKAITLFVGKPLDIPNLLDVADTIATWLDKGDVPR